MSTEDNVRIQGIRRAIGEELRQARERKNIMLEDVAHETKINLNYLKAIEVGDFSFLPQTYVRAFIRAYAKKVGLDPATMLKPLDRLTERILEERTSPHGEDEKPVEFSRFRSLLNSIKKTFGTD